MAQRKQKGRGSPGPRPERGSKAAAGKIAPSSLWGCVALIFVGLIVFLPAMRGSWLWDDSRYILHNDLVHSPDGYWLAWTTLNALGANYADSYHPLSTLAEWLEWRLWGDQTPGYHVVNVVLHITSALLLWRLFARLGFAFAWVGAMLFLTHPLMVESVAWMTELKNTLSLPLWLMAALTWLDYEEKKNNESYRGALLWFVLSLMAKATGVMLPVILLAHAWWKRGKVDRADGKALAPFFALSLVAGVVTLLPAHLAKGVIVIHSAWSLGASVASVGWTVLFLFGKCLFPAGLMPDYPGFAIVTPTVIDFVPWVILAGVGALLVFGWRRAAWTRPALLGVGFFLLNLMPVILFVAKNYPDMAWSMDHLVYLPIIGLIGWWIAWLGALRQRLSPRAQKVEWAAIAAVLLIFCTGSFSYAGVFAGQDPFWAYMLKKEPGNWRVRYNYASSLETDQDRPDDAIAQYKIAIGLNPASDEIQFDLAHALKKRGRFDEAATHYLQEIKLNPRDVRPYLDLAEIAQQAGRVPEAEAYIEQARAVAPDNSAPISALAALRIKTGRADEGLGLYGQAVKMDPDEMALRYNYGCALLQARKLPEAVEQLQAAVALDGNFVAAHQNLGVALTQTDAIPEAIEQFEAVVTLSPGSLMARDNLGLALAQTGHLAEAGEQFRAALEIDPNDATARTSLAKVLSLQSNTPTGKGGP
jgi:tetratricopeptide (TPR) repeat protein